MDGQWDTLHDDLALHRIRSHRAQMCPHRDGLTVLDGEPAVREVDDDSSITAGGKRVAVDGALGPDRQLTANPRAEGCGVVARLGDLVGERPAGTELVQRIEHRGDSEVVVVLADRSRARLLEVGEPRRLEAVEQGRGHPFGAHLVEAVPRGVGPRVGTRRHHAEGVHRSRVGVADLWFREPPRRGQAVGLGQLGDAGADERIDRIDHRRCVSQKG